MRFMVIVKADKNSEAGVMPSTEMLTAMGKFNEEMIKAGVMLAGEGLHPTSKGARIKYSGKQPSVSHGPFSGTSDLVAGFWLIQVKSREEAIEWMKRAPFDGGAEIEIRQVFDAEDFGGGLTPELAGRGGRWGGRGGLVRRRQARRDRRSLHRGQGSARRLLDDRCQVAGGGDRVGQALPGVE